MTEDLKAAPIIADLLCSSLLHPESRHANAVQARRGIIDSLYCWEREAIEWLAANWHLAAKAPMINLWTATVVIAYVNRKAGAA